MWMVYLVIFMIMGLSSNGYSWAYDHEYYKWTIESLRYDLAVRQARTARTEFSQHCRKAPEYQLSALLN